MTQHGVPFRTKNASGVGARDVALTDRQHGLTVTKDARTAAKVHLIELVDHERRAATRQDEARVDEPVQCFGRRLDHFLLFFGQSVVYTCVQLVTRLFAHTHSQHNCDTITNNII